MKEIIPAIFLTVSNMFGLTGSLASVRLSDTSSADTVTITREISNVANNVNNEFVYSITESSDNPALIQNLPFGAVVTFSDVAPVDGVATSSAILDLSDLIFSQVGDYTITIAEVESSDGVNYPVDYDNTYDVLISVRNEVDADNRPTGEMTATLIDRVINSDGDKVSDIVFSAATAMTHIELSKEVSGNLGRTDEYFKYRIEIFGRNSGEQYTISGQDEVVFYDQNAISPLFKYTVGNENYVYLKHGQTITIGLDDNVNELPIGTHYVITEVGAEDYATYIDGSETEGKIASEKIAKASYDLDYPSQNTTHYVNFKESAVMTGVSSLLWPFVGLGLIGLFGFGAYWMLNKRKK